MKNLILYSVIALCIAFNSGCKKDNSGDNPEEGEPIVTPVGTPAGLAVTVYIGAGGGTLSSSDGMLQLTVPAGVVSAATVFSIQPISNQCPNGIANAYRLLPEGITFAQPVSLSFSYADILPENEKFTTVAYQNADKTWSAPESVSLHAAGNKLSVETKHFSDWAIFQKLAINPSDTTLKTKSKAILKVIMVGFSPKTNDLDGLHNWFLITNETLVSKWQINGKDHPEIDEGLVYATSINTAKYIVSPIIPPADRNPVAVSATLENVSFTLNGETFKNPQVIAHIKIVGEAFFKVVFTSSRPHQPVTNTTWFTETDMGSMSVKIFEDETIIVSDIHNESAIVLPISLSDEVNNCIYTLASPGDGPYNVSPGVTFDGVYSSYDKMVYVALSGQTYPMGNAPAFQKSCNGGTPEMLGGEQQPTAPVQFSFDATKDYQEFVTVIPGNGIWPAGFLKTAVTKVKVNE